MDPDMLKKCPQFESLLTNIDAKLSKDKASPAVQETFDQAQSSLKRARMEWLSNKILHNELHELLADMEIQHLENSLSSDEEKLLDVFGKSLTYAEVPDYLRFCPDASSNSSLFGLTVDDVDRHNPVKVHQADVVHILTPKLEEKLRKKCETLYAYFDPLGDQKTSSEKLLSAKAHSLHSLVEEKQSVLSREREHLREVRQKRDKQFWGYLQKLVECLSIMEKLIRDLKCEKQTQTDNLTVHHLWADCSITRLKISNAKLDVLCDTYTLETVKALAAVKSHLENATEQGKRELAATTQSLHAFQRLGPEFTSIVDEVTKLKKELEDLRWGFQRVSHHQGAPQASATSAGAGISSGRVEHGGDG